MRETNNKSKNLQEEMMMNVDHYRSTLIPANLQGYSQSFKADLLWCSGEIWLCWEHQGAILSLAWLHLLFRNFYILGHPLLQTKQSIDGFFFNESKHMVCYLVLTLIALCTAVLNIGIACEKSNQSRIHSRTNFSTFCSSSRRIMNAAAREGDF